jgi:hypothetical protein
MDYAEYCTSAVQVVHSTILTEMVIDGTFDDIYNAELGKLSDLDCATEYQKMQDTTLQLTGSFDLIEVALQEYRSVFCCICIPVLICIFLYCMFIPICFAICVDVAGIFACYAYIMATAVVVALGTPLWRRIRKKFLKSLVAPRDRDLDRVQRQSTGFIDDLSLDEPNVYRSVASSSSERSEEASYPIGSGRGSHLQLVGIRGPIAPHDSDS